MLHPCVVAIEIRLPRFVEIDTAQIDLMTRFYLSQKLWNFVDSKKALFLGDGKYIDYDPEKNWLVIKGGGDGVPGSRPRKTNSSRRKMPAPGNQELWVEPAVEGSGRGGGEE